jgi:hypothetical protein
LKAWLSKKKTAQPADLALGSPGFIFKICNQIKKRKIKKKKIHIQIQIHCIQAASKM